MGFWQEFYPRSKPRAATGGIKAQSKRGQFGASWWAKRWISVLESFDIGARLARGRSYARRGQVLSVDVQEGAVTAKVQGSQARPYAIEIAVKTLSKEDWGKVIDALAAQALFTAKLLAGEMPQDIEQVFTTAGVSLFPQKRNDLQTECSCPDYSNPCKHIAAVYYLLGEEFDRDPFLLFRLRGLERDDLLKQLTQASPAAPSAATVAPPEAVEPLPKTAKAFWTKGEMPAGLFGDVTRPPQSAAWPRRLGNFPFWRGSQRFLDALTDLYSTAGEEGLEVFLGEPAT